MKKFLAFAFAGAMALSVTACGAKDEVVKEVEKAVAEVVAEVEEEAEETEEEATEEATEAVEGSEEDDTFKGLSFTLPEGWDSGVSGDRMVWIAAPDIGNTIFLEVFTSDPGEDLEVNGTGKFTSQAEGTEPVDIAAFEAGNFTWEGYSIIFPGYFGDVTYVLLASNEDSETGKYVGARIDLGTLDAPFFTLDSEEIQSILASCEFKY